MQPRFVLALSVGAFVLSAWSLFVQYRTVSPVPLPADVVTGRAERPALSSDDRASLDAVTTLQEKIHQLERTIARLNDSARDRSERGPVELPDLSPSETVHPELSAPDYRAQERRARQQQFFEEQFYSEDVDRAWSDRMSNTLSETLSDLPGVNSALSYVECQSALCRLDVNLDKSATEAFILAFTAQVARQGTQSQTFIQDDGGSANQLKIYLSRAGTALPSTRPVVTP
ncbi:hypothetical protein [Teredinibacter turnerae]|uniref:hypothetical protein n=1 Tax=Teredinibacter turnerae TaxID=2426 RepID=UPI00048F15DB|nr:hypothetical protein [Teredinibacter turnerae]